MKTFVCAAASFLLLQVGPWQLSALGGFAAGLWVLRRAWLSGGAAVAFAWAASTGLRHVEAPAETANLLQTVGAFAGLPGWLLPVASVAFGFVLGAAAGLVGSTLTNKTHKWKTSGH